MRSSPLALEGSFFARDSLTSSGASSYSLHAGSALDARAVGDVVVWAPTACSLGTYGRVALRVLLKVTHSLTRPFRAFPRPRPSPRPLARSPGALVA